MLSVLGKCGARNCDGTNRRDFLRVGSIAAGGLTLSGLLRQRAFAAASGRSVKNTSVVWLFLYGGPTQVETFDPKMEAPAEFRSTVGAVNTRIPGEQIGGLFPQIGQVADRMAFVRSFSHGNAGHTGATHWVMTGYDYPPADQGLPPVKPSSGAILARVRGTNDAQTGMPTFVRINGVYGDGPAWLGAAYGPFDSAGEAHQNMNLTVDSGRISERRGLLDGLDRIDRHVDRSRLMEGLDAFEQQAFGLILGRAKEAFDLSKEDPRTRGKYGAELGERMLLARRLCEAGCGFVTVGYSNAAQGWDMHGGPPIADQMKQCSPQMDQAVSAFVDDCVQRGLDEEVLLVITGEFGRTPRVNGNAGRDHWPHLSTLALAGGGLRMGQFVGQSDARVSYPRTTPITPGDLMATVFHVLGIDQRQQFLDPQGRPQYMVPDGSKPIAELI